MTADKLTGFAFLFAAWFALWAVGFSYASDWASWEAHHAASGVGFLWYGLLAILAVLFQWGCAATSIFCLVCTGRAGWSWARRNDPPRWVYEGMNAI